MRNFIRLPSTLPTFGGLGVALSGFLLAAGGCSLDRGGSLTDGAPIFSGDGGAGSSSAVDDFGLGGSNGAGAGPARGGGGARAGTGGTNASGGNAAGGGNSAAGGAGGGSPVPMPICKGVTVPLLLSGLKVTSSTVAGTSNLDPACADGAGNENVYAIYLSGSSKLAVTTDFGKTKYDTVIYLRSSCANVNTELACDDAGDLGDSFEVSPLPKGLYFIIVDGHTGESGNYEIKATVTPL